MRLYSLDAAKINYDDLTMNPYIGEITNPDVEMGDIIELDGSYYTIGWMDLKTKNVGVHLINDSSGVESGEYEELLYEDEITCPVCGYADDCSYEHTSSTSIQCGKCGAILDVEVEYTVTYSTKVAMAPRIVRGTK